jgi:hypothetical protein
LGRNTHTAGHPRMRRRSLSIRDCRRWSSGKAPASHTLCDPRHRSQVHRGPLSPLWTNVARSPSPAERGAEQPSVPEHEVYVDHIGARLVVAWSPDRGDDRLSPHHTRGITLPKPASAPREDQDLNPAAAGYDGSAPNDTVRKQSALHSGHSLAVEPDRMSHQPTRVNVGTRALYRASSGVRSYNRGTRPLVHRRTTL